MKDPVLKDISLNIRKSQITFIIGHVGSGKSTLMKAMVGETQPVGVLDKYRRPNCCICQPGTMDAKSDDSRKQLVCIKARPPKVQHSHSCLQAQARHRRVSRQICHEGGKDWCLAKRWTKTAGFPRPRPLLAERCRPTTTSCV